MQAAEVKQLTSFWSRGIVFVVILFGLYGFIMFMLCKAPLWQQYKVNLLILLLFSPLLLLAGVLVLPVEGSTETELLCSCLRYSRVVCEFVLPALSLFTHCLVSGSNSSCPFSHSHVNDPSTFQQCADPQTPCIVSHSFMSAQKETRSGLIEGNKTQFLLIN